MNKNEIRKTILKKLREGRVLMREVGVLVNNKGFVLTGSLLKYDGSELTYEEVLSIYNKFPKCLHVKSNLKNWDLNSGVRRILEEYEDLS